MVVDNFEIWGEMKSLPALWSQVCNFFLVPDPFSQDLWRFCLGSLICIWMDFTVFFCAFFSLSRNGAFPTSKLWEKLQKKLQRQTNDAATACICIAMNFRIICWLLPGIVGLFASQIQARFYFPFGVFFWHSFAIYCNAFFWGSHLHAFFLPPGFSLDAPSFFVASIPWVLFALNHTYLQKTPPSFFLHKFFTGSPLGGPILAVNLR